MTLEISRTPFSSLFRSYLLLCLVLGLQTSAVRADESGLVFLPGGHLFEPLLADPREPKDAVLRCLDADHYDCSIGGTLDLAALSAPDGSRLAWGALGGALLSIDVPASKFLDQSFRLQDLDPWWGTYVSGTSGAFSARLEYHQGSSHLGDHEFYTVAPVDYRRSGPRFLGSFRPNDNFRFYLGLGGWFFSVPEAPPFFGQGGLEIFTGPTKWDGNFLRGYFACDLELGYESAGNLDGNFQAGLEWSLPGKGPNLRLALIYAPGASPYGQPGQTGNHWSLGAFFDP